MGVDERMLLVLGSSMLGDGEPDLGEKLLQAFLSQMLEADITPSRIICMNSGIFLTTEGSAVEDLMLRFAARGCEILTCGTCLEYYGRKDNLLIGRSTNMADTVRAMVSFEKVLQP